MQALTIAFEEKETRGLVPFYVRAIGLTMGVGLLAVLSLFLIAVVPAVIDMLPLPELWRDRISLIRWPILAGLVLLALGLVYRFAAETILCESRVDARYGETVVYLDWRIVAGVA